MAEYAGIERRKFPTHCQTEVLETILSIKVDVTRLADLHLHDQEERTRMHAENQTLMKTFQELFYGNGKPGLIIEVDRIKQINRMLMLAVGTSLTAVIVMGTQSLLRLFTMKP